MQRCYCNLRTTFQQRCTSNLNVTGKQPKNNQKTTWKQPENNLKQHSDILDLHATRFVEPQKISQSVEGKVTLMQKVSKRHIVTDIKVINSFGFSDSTQIQSGSFQIDQGNKAFGVFWREEFELHTQPPNNVAIGLFWGFFATSLWGRYNRNPKTTLQWRHF